MFQARGPYAFENQPIALGILTQPTRYKRAESNSLADKKGPQQETVVLKHFYQSFIPEEKPKFQVIAILKRMCNLLIIKLSMPLTRRKKKKGVYIL